MKKAGISIYYLVYIVQLCPFSHWRVIYFELSYVTAFFSYLDCFLLIVVSIVKIRQMFHLKNFHLILIYQNLY